jgi:hypothetical protein
VEEREKSKPPKTEMPDHPRVVCKNGGNVAGGMGEDWESIDHP